MSNIALLALREMIEERDRLIRRLKGTRTLQDVIKTNKGKRK